MKTDYYDHIIVTTQEFLDSVNLINDWIIVKSPRFNEKLRSGLYAPVDYDRESNERNRFRPTCAEFYKGSLEKGDIVYFHYLTLQRAEGDGRCFTADIHQEMIECYYFIKVTDLYCVVRNGEILMCDNFCLVEPLCFPESEIQTLYQNGRTGNTGIMRHCSTEQKVFGLKPKAEFYYAAIKEGDYVLIEDNCDIFLEVELHRKFDKPYYLVKQDHLVLKIDDLETTLKLSKPPCQLKQDDEVKFAREQTEQREEQSRIRSGIRTKQRYRGKAGWNLKNG